MLLTNYQKNLNVEDKMSKDKNFLTKAEWEEIEEATKIKPKKNYTIWVFALFFVSTLILIGVDT